MAIRTGTAQKHSLPLSSSQLKRLGTIVWLLGTAGLLGEAFVKYLRLKQHVAASIRLHDNVYICDELESAFTLGLVFPRIYLPSDLQEPQLSHVLAHERAHLARGDHWWKMMGFLLRSVYWFNPVFWLAYALLCKDIELACDERVYRGMTQKERIDYTQTLLDQSRSKQFSSRFQTAVCALAFGEVSVKDRVAAGLNYKKPAILVVTTAAVIYAASALCFLTEPSKTLSIDFWQTM